MRRLSRFLFVCCMCLAFIFPVSVVQGGGIQTTGFGDPDPPEVPGTWVAGATPSNVDLSKPPIVFVQGMNGRAQDWWDETEYHGINDMYSNALSAGYRTAFVQLNDAAGNGAANQMDNGRMLAQLLGQIYNHFGQKVNIVAHSKGGPDTQAALIHYNAHGYVNKVVTLGSPHRGSHLADLAYSWYAGWLAELLGQKSPGLYSLQVGEMAKYRQLTDANPNARKNTYYTLAGNSWGPSFTALWTGGLTLSSHGENDGLVNVSSASLPYGSHSTIKADHDSIRKGSTSFSRIEPFLRTATPTSTQSQPEYEAAPVTSSAEQFLAGGTITANKQIERTISINDSTKEVFIQVMTKSPAVNVTLVSPSGKINSKKSFNYVVAQDHDFFATAHIQGFRLSQADAGTWKVRIQGNKDDAYFLVAQFKGDSTLNLDVPDRAKLKNIPIKLQLYHPEDYDLGSMSVDVKIVTPNGKEANKIFSTGYQMKMRRDLSSLGGYVTQLPPQAKPGLYNITTQISGKTKQGKPFARTIVKTVYVEK